MEMNKIEAKEPRRCFSISSPSTTSKSTTDPKPIKALGGRVVEGRQSRRPLEKVSNSLGSAPSCSSKSKTRNTKCSPKKSRGVGERLTLTLTLDEIRELSPSFKKQSSTSESARLKEDQKVSKYLETKATAIEEEHDALNDGRGGDGIRGLED